MSRVLSRRLAKLEARNAPRGTGLVVLPWDQWPADDDRPAWDRIRAEHPHGRIFVPSQAGSLEAWQRESGR
jgi:hypothetical protein